MSVMDLHVPTTTLSVDGTTVLGWYGLRYAQAPGRFMPSQSATGRLVVQQQRDVPIFPQLPSRLAAVMGAEEGNPQSEDAFFLNIWAPEQAKDLPVLFFIHGGAWMTGGGTTRWYDGSKLAAQGVVVVNVNYRLGALGHLGAADAHELPLPAADLVLALQWVREHIAHCGGDASNLTVMGQSSGGWYAHLLSVLPHTQGWLKRVALLSMGTRTAWTPAYQAEVTHKVDAALNGNVHTAPLDALLKTSIAVVAQKQVQLAHAPAAFLPVASAAFPEHLLDATWAAEACHAEAVYVRHVADESATFFFNVPAQRDATQEQVDAVLSQWPVSDLPAVLVRNGAFAGVDSGLSPYRQLVAASSWQQFQRFPEQYAAALHAKNRPVKMTHFSIESHQPDVHSGHCFDLPFQFGNLEAWQHAPMMAGFDKGRFEALSTALIGEVVDFVKHGCV